MKTSTRTLQIDARLNGPPRSANGGFACGTIAQALGGTASVRLIRPVPLETPLEVEADVDGLVAQVVDPRHQLVAEVRQVDPFTMSPPVTPGFDDAEAARASSPLHGFRHLLSNCVVCGPKRTDGLHVTPGPLATRSDVLVAPFLPLERDATDGVVHPAAVWGALDCPSYPATSLLDGRIGLLGTLAAHRNRDVLVGERLVVVGWTIENHGRSTQTASALLDERGMVVASARAVWIELRHQGLVRLAGRFRQSFARSNRSVEVTRRGL
ncbi:hypothetical protein K2F54_10635 [Cryobacterium sp. 1639]|uniref:hypothetical protein n=1 Tax=Cryobacterium inferilacus TaxID=2866629 RepID=UPI001C735CD1|nr:hypothetical protein [Cryobacterium sp. 1639]MBX0300432.1 hypothetical protein [Cryobacterium sp. 1639]